MTGGQRPMRVALLLLLPLFLPLVSATGGGLLMAGDSFTLVGDQEVGPGDVNISIEVRAYDQASNGFIEMSLAAGDGTPLAVDNRSVALSAGQGVVEEFDVANVPIGTHSLTLRLWGDVGLEFENNRSDIQVFVQRLAPANISLENAAGWDVIPQSANATLRDGDSAWILAEVSNAGDVTWSGVAEIGGDSTAVNVTGSSTSVVNLSVGPLLEGSHPFTLELREGNLTIESDSITLEVGPPPLARPTLSLTSDRSNPSLGEIVNWTVFLDNDGEIYHDAPLVCTFPLGIEVLNESVSVQAGENLSRTLTFDVRPGELECATSSTERIHDDSILSAGHTYDMAAGHIVRAGSDGLTVTGGPFHVGDALPLAILVHNGGDLVGDGTLQAREGAGNGANMGLWQALESRSLEVGSSLELGANHPTTTAGERRIEWRITSSNSLVAEDLTGHLNLSILPSQDLDVTIESTGWTLADGLSVEVTTSLSAGETRTILLEAGTKGAAGEVIQISTEVELSPGQRTLSYDLGQPAVSSMAWVRVSPVGWSAQADAEDETVIIRPDPTTSVVLDSVQPSAPKMGKSAVLSYRLINSGGGATLAGSLTLIDMATDEILWTDTVDAVESGQTENGVISLSTWPASPVVDLRIEWRTDTTEAEAAGSYLSEKATGESDELNIDWISLLYGALAGLVLGLVTRTVMRARAGVPLLSRRERGTREVKPKRKKKVEEKVEVACPACDQRLRVPNTYSGTARCPACAQTFPVVASVEEEVDEEEDEEQEEDDDWEDEDLKEFLDDTTEEEVEETPPAKVAKPAPQEKSSASSDDVIRCPDCRQKLKVPFTRRPVKARCPACKCEFRALKE
jgi:uncharacterized CHY-type Zn-finger protein